MHLSHQGTRDTQAWRVQPHHYVIGKVKLWVKKDNKGSFRETGGGHDRQTKARRCKHESLEGKAKKFKLARQRQQHMKFRDWHTVTTGSVCWKEMLSVFCVWTRTYTYFSQYTWTWQFLSSSLLPFPEVCYAAMPTKCAESIAWQRFHNKLSWPGGYPDFLGSINEVNCHSRITFSLQKYMTYTVWRCHQQATLPPFHTYLPDICIPSHKQTGKTPITESQIEEPRVA